MVKSADGRGFPKAPEPRTAELPDLSEDLAPAPHTPSEPVSAPTVAAAEAAETGTVTEADATTEATEVAPRPPTPRPPYRSQQPHPVPHIGERPPTYGPEPTTLPAASPDELALLAPDTVIEGAQYGPTTLRAASVRGDSARYLGEPRRDSLLVTRFGEGEEGLLLAVLAAPGRSRPQSAASAAEACRQLAAAIGRSRPELAADLRAGARDRLRYGLQRLTARAAAPLRAEEASASPTAEARSESATEGAERAAGSADAGSLHCLLFSLDPEATHRAAFGTGPGGLYLLRSGHWIDAYGARLLHHPDGRESVPQPSEAPPRPFRFRLVPATPGDILLLCSPGLAEPIAEEPAVAHFLSSHWAHPHPPGTVDFLRQVQVRAKGYADDRTAAALWTE
ncbi:protein phosphatase 2C domain-containing protein [Kitasatospora sp. HPMI-4]|uniref:protein phosphatase 2C domain-containing protein n=1 Tax=Kitasatospora sp. HPMI-4 TaxID=3448443 RepID=UPI003F198834